MEEVLSAIRLYAGSGAPVDYARCEGQRVAVQEQQPLYALLVNAFGGSWEERTFQYPNLPATGGVAYVLCTRGYFPLPSDAGARADELVGVLKLWGSNFVRAPAGYAECDGRELPVAGNELLAHVLWTSGVAAYGSGSDRFNLPRLEAPPGLRWIICVQGAPPEGGAGGRWLDRWDPEGWPPGDEYGMVKLFAGHRPPRGYVACNGQELPVAGYRQLFELLGTRFGGDGAERFRVPSLPAPEGMRYILFAERPVVSY